MAINRHSSSTTISDRPYAALDYSALKKRVAAGEAETAASATFVELTPSTEHVCDRDRGSARRHDSRAGHAEHVAGPGRSDAGNLPRGEMIQITPQMRILVAVEAVDFRKGIDGLAAVCRQALGDNPLEGAVYVFRNRAGTTLKLLAYDGQGLWLCTNRIRVSQWPSRAMLACPQGVFGGCAPEGAALK